jgi:RNA polymerase sigma factor (TIGR02999 family)
MPNEPLADLARRADGGDAAARDALFTALYGELHRLAEVHIHRSAGNLTLSATTLLHEAYLDIAGRDSLAFPDRSRFLQYASRAMRGLIIQYVRRRGARKRGGELTFTTLDEDRAQSAEAVPDMEALGTALDALGDLDPQLAELVDLKFFCGFSLGEIASIRGMSERTVQRDWAKARLVLRRLLENG